jgi:hypothetical protein
MYIIMGLYLTHVAMGSFGTRKKLLSYAASMSSSYRFLTQRTEFKLTVILFKRHIERTRKKFHVRNPYCYAVSKLKMCCSFSARI